MSSGNPLPQCNPAEEEEKANLLDCAQLQTTGNPYEGTTMYLDPDYQRHLEAFEASNADDPQILAAVEVIKEQPTAIWLDTFDMLDNGDAATARRSLKEHLAAATAQQNSANSETGIQPMAVQIVALLHPVSGLAEKTPETLGYTAEDMVQYKVGFVDELKALADSYPNIRFVVVLEPHTIPDILATIECFSEIQCQRVSDVTNLTRYGIETLGNTENSNIYLYLGLGHSAWLTSEAAVKRIPTWLASLEVDVEETLKGFATNTAAYIPLYEEMIANRPSNLEPGVFNHRAYLDEKSLIETIDSVLKQAMPNFRFGFITDTSRNGWGSPDRPTVPGGVESRLDLRNSRNHWCNVSTAGIGHTFEVNPTDMMAHIHAYTWLKQPGYSDGVPMEITGDKPHACDPANGDALDNAPEGGLWFGEHFIQLIQNSWPRLWEVAQGT